MSPVLSQEEIDALLTAASDQNSSGGHASAFEGDPRTSVIGYNFRRPDRRPARARTPARREPSACTAPVRRSCTGNARPGPARRRTLGAAGAQRACVTPPSTTSVEPIT